jgi:hypothetical protein
MKTAPESAINLKNQCLLWFIRDLKLTDFSGKGLRKNLKLVGTWQKLVAYAWRKLIDTTKEECRKTFNVDVGQNEKCAVLIFSARNCAPYFLLCCYSEFVCCGVWITFRKQSTSSTSVFQKVSVWQLRNCRGKPAKAFGSTETARGKPAKAFGSTEIVRGKPAKAFGSTETARGKPAKAFGSTETARGKPAKAFGSAETARGKPAIHNC